MHYSERDWASLRGMPYPRTYLASAKLYLNGRSFSTTSRSLAPEPLWEGYRRQSELNWSMSTKTSYFIERYPETVALHRITDIVERSNTTFSSNLRFLFTTCLCAQRLRAKGVAMTRPGFQSSLYSKRQSNDSIWWWFLMMMEGKLLCQGTLEVTDSIVFVAHRSDQSPRRISI